MDNLGVLLLLSQVVTHMIKTEHLEDMLISMEDIMKTFITVTVWND